MTPVAEEAGKVASGAIDALKAQPILLSIVLLQFFMLGALTYSSIHRQNAIDKQFTHVFELLETCLAKTGVRGQLDHLLPKG